MFGHRILKYVQDGRRLVIGATSNPREESRFSVDKAVYNELPPDQF